MKMKELVEKIKINGSLNSLIVRRYSNNQFKMILRHRNEFPFYLNGIEEVYIKELTDMKQQYI